MRRLLILPAACLLLTVALSSAVAYGSAPPIVSHAVTSASPTGFGAGSPARPLTLGASLAVLTTGTGVVQGHIYDYLGVPVAGATVTAYVHDDQGALLWERKAVTGADGLYVLSEAPATTHGSILTETQTGDLLYETELVFMDPGTTTHDVQPTRVAWSAAEGGPWQEQPWWNPYVEIVGTGTSGSPVYAGTQLWGEYDLSPTGHALALPGAVHLAAYSFFSNEVAVWDAADAGGAPVPVALGSTTTLPFTFDQHTAMRVNIRKPVWKSGAPGSAISLRTFSFPAGLKWEFLGESEGPSGFTTTWADKTYTAPDAYEHTLGLTIPTKATPGYFFRILVHDPNVRYGVFVLGLADYFQVCTLKASKTSIRSGSTVKLSGVVPVQGHDGPTAGKPKYVWIYKRTRAASAAPIYWDPTYSGWKLVSRVRTDGYGRYSKSVAPSRSTWYVARYKEDDWYWGAYTSVRKVRVY